MAEIDPEVFLEQARVIFRRRKRSEKTELRHFRAHFGTTPKRCAQVWRLLHCKGGALFANSASTTEEKNAKPKHMLWGLMLLKIYGSESILSTLAGADEKIFRKWAWRFVFWIADLKDFVVSSTLWATFVLMIEEQHEEFLVCAMRLATAHVH